VQAGVFAQRDGAEQDVADDLAIHLSNERDERAGLGAQGIHQVGLGRRVEGGEVHLPRRGDVGGLLGADDHGFNRAVFSTATGWVEYRSRRRD